MPYAGTTPVLPATDMEASIRFYRDVLGFTEAWRWGEPVEVAGLEADGLTIQLFACRQPGIAEWTSFRLQLDTGIESLAERARVAGAVHPNGPLERKPWDLLEVTLLDPSGVAIVVWQEG